MAGVLSVAILSAAPLSAWALVTAEIVPISAPVLREEQKVNYMSLAGIVKEINVSNVQGSNLRYVLVEDADGQLANFVVAEDTVFVTDTPLEVGARVIGYYDADLPMIMIYPMQPKAEVMAVELPEGLSIKIDRFDASLLSYDKELKLNISPETEIIQQDGSEFIGELDGRKLVVLYSITTKSIPPQTSPIRVIVLYEKAVPIEHEGLTPEQDITITGIVVENVQIEAPTPFITDSGIPMVPLRAIAEALGYAVGWDDVTASVTLGSDITLPIGRDHYTNKNGAPISLLIAPIIVEGRTFVPLAFFREVVPMNNAYVFEGLVVIDNGEKMN